MSTGGAARIFRRWLGAFAGALAAGGATAAAPRVEVPAWVRETAAAPAPAVPDDAKAVTLVDEGVLTVAADGRRSTRRRVVLRVLQPEGREQAVAAVPYQQRSDLLKGFSAWLLNPGAAPRAYGKAETIDTSFEELLLYSENRTATIDASTGIVAGGVFAWEAVVEEPPYLAQGAWVFQGRSPVAVARFELRLPPGWQAEGRLLNHAPVSAAPAGANRVWELHDLPGWTAEPLAPPAGRSLATLRFDLAPPAGGKNRPALQAFGSWADLVPFANRFVAAAARPTPAIRAKAEELARGRAPGWEQIAALARYAQNLRYVAITANLRTGGGFAPHPAEDVLRCGYGDCKDKSALLCALLAALGYEAHPVLCFSGDRAAVAPGWPSPVQFNHMLVAIAVDESVHSPFVLTDAPLGRVLLFDPTDRFTPLLDFPAENQGGLVLVCKPGNDRLSTVPLSPAGRNTFARRLDVKLRPGGAIDVVLRDTARGDAAAAQRAFFFGHAEIVKTVDRWLKENVPGAVTGRAEVRDDPATGEFTTTVEFTAPAYGRVIDGRLLVFKPLVAGKFTLPALVKPVRVQPLVVPAVQQEFTAEFTLPDGYEVVETGAALEQRTAFGTYTARTTRDGRTLKFSRRIELPGAELEPARYDEFRAFLEQVRKSENTQVVLEKR